MCVLQGSGGLQKPFAVSLYPSNGSPGLQGAGEELLALSRSWYLLLFAVANLDIVFKK